MGAWAQGYGETQVDVKESGVRIWLPGKLFGAGWVALRERLGTALGSGRVLVDTRRVMTQRGEGEEAPRWKATGLDAFSWLVFQLLVPAEHELVRLWQAIDWRRVNEIAAPCYRNGKRGQRAWAPAQLVAMLTVMFLYGIGSETQIVRLLSENIVWCWFCGFGLLGPFPAHDALYDFRQRVGPQRFEQLLTMVVQACQAEQLIGNDLVCFDPTSLVAAGHRWSPYERAVLVARTLSRYLELVWSQQCPEEPWEETWQRLAAEVALEVLPHQGLKEVEPEKVAASVQGWEEQAQGHSPAWQRSSEELVEAWIQEAEEVPLPPSPQEPEEERVRRWEWLKKKAQQVVERLSHTRGDGDAKVGRTTGYTWFCGYWLGFVVDALHQVITAVHLGPGNERHAEMVAPALRAHIQRVGQPKKLALDSAFDDPQVYALVDEQQMVVYVTSRSHATPPDGGYGTDRLTWDQPDQPPRCPADHPLQKIGSASRTGAQVYQGTACADCALYAACFPSGSGQPKRFRLQPESHRRWQQNRRQCQTDEYRTAQRARFVSEGRFGLAKQYHHAHRAPYRSQQMNRIAGLMMAWVMNWRLLLRQRKGGSTD